MFHNVLYATVENVAELVDCVYFHILVFAEPVDLGTVHVVGRVKIILADALFMHRFP